MDKQKTRKVRFFVDKWHYYEGMAEISESCGNSFSGKIIGKMEFKKLTLKEMASQWFKSIFNQLRNVIKAWQEK